MLPNSVPSISIVSLGCSTADPSLRNTPTKPGLSKTKDLRADMLGGALRFMRRALDGSCRLLGGRHEVFKRLACLFDAALGGFAQFIGNFKGSIGHFRLLHVESG